MARVLLSQSQTIASTLTHQSQTLIFSPASRLLSFRSRSGRPDKVEFIEIDLSGTSSDSDSSSVRRLEDVLQSIAARRSEPDWIPFRPGSSYWVPPFQRKVMGPIKIAEFVGRVPANEEDSKGLSSVFGARGWPSSSYFMQGRLPHSTRNTETLQSDDEED